jgi:GT2 family glycosyltransferase
VRLSVVVPATNHPPTLARCLEALGHATNAHDEVHVVTDPPGLGPAAARNIGVDATSGEIIVFVDADVVVHEDALARLRQCLRDDPDVVAVFGSYDDRVATHGLVAAYRNLLHHVVHQRHAGPVPTFWAGLGAVRRDAFTAVGGFDADRYPRPSIEDVELGARLAARGIVRLDASAQGTHLKEWTLRSMVETDVLRRGAPWVQLLVDRRHVPRTLNLGARERASVVAAIALVGALVRRKPIATATLAAAQIALNDDLFRVLGRRRGAGGIAAGLALHIVHQVSALASIPVGLTRSTLGRRAGRA